jgi:dihydroxyacetone kinase
MTHIVGRPEDFAADAAAGFADVYAGLVRAVPGGIVRAADGRDGKVAVVIGGGSGHYPAFAGYVGTGLADAAVLGDVFASPPAQRVLTVTREVAGPAGALLGFGNYTGDVLNFAAAASTLAGEGIPAVLLAVTDDVASSPAGAESSRRGIAGDVVVFKIAGAAAEEGYDLAGVVRVANRANDRTRTLGVAFSGCTLPGQDAPLFTLAAGTMGVGLGIHGEPGISDDPIATVAELAGLLVDRLLAERPAAADGRAAVILNGLGGTKYEELFGLWHHAGPLLRNRGLTLLAPEVGELVTSLDMAGCSLTICWLDDELERLWLAPAWAPAFRRGPAPAPAAAPAPAPPAAARAAGGDFAASDSGAGQPAAGRRWPDASSTSRRAAGCVATALEVARADLRAREHELGQLDAYAGDGDHGQAMVRGLAAAVIAARAAVAGGAGAGSTLAAAAAAWAERAGGTSGALWGTALAAFGRALTDLNPVTPESVADGAAEALLAVMRAGGAKPGDKTMVDAMSPFASGLAQAVVDGQTLSGAWALAAERAAAAAERTSELVPARGRARLHPGRSAGHPDAGAVSFAAIALSVGRHLDGDPA